MTKQEKREQWNQQSSDEISLDMATLRAVGRALVFYHRAIVIVVAHVEVVDAK